MASEHITDFTSANFQNEVLSSDIPVLVDFWAVWCGPCKAIAPLLEKAAEDYQDQLRIGKVDVDQNQQLAMQYQVRAIPTLLLFKGGQVVSQHTGALNRGQLDSFVSSAL